MEQITISADQSQQQAQAAPEQSHSISQPAQAPTEKMVPQSQVDSLAGRIRHEAYQKGLNEGRAQQQQPVNQPVQTQVNSTFGGMPQTDINNLVAQQVQQHFGQLQQKFADQQTAEQGQKIANEFTSRMTAASGKYEDFDTVTKDFPFRSFPHAVLESLKFDNTADIMYELAKNPSKFKDLQEFALLDAQNAQEGIPTNLAFKEMQRLSDSIRLNEQASNVKTANPPLSHIKSSPTTASNGSINNNSVKDMRHWLYNRRK